jgi:hypothetical protein
MENNVTLEQELTARIMVHKMSIVGGVLMQDYMNRNQGIPNFQLVDLAYEYSEEVMKKAMENGTFNELYEKAWEKIKDKLDEYTKVI